MALALALIGCADSQKSVEIAAFDAPTVPSWVYVEAKRITALPSGNAKVREVKKLIVRLRRSELRKNAAINALIENQEYTLAYLRKRGRK